MSGLDFQEHAKSLQRRIVELETFVTRIEKDAAESVAVAEELADAKQKVETAHRRSEENMRRANAVLDTVIDGIFSIDEAGIVESANMSGFRMLNCSASNLLGTHLAQYVAGLDRYGGGPGHPGAQPEGFQKMVGRRLECIATPRDGRPFPVELTLSRVPFRDPVRFTCVMRDVTEQRLAEQEIQKLALYDQLTLIANRYEFETRLTTAINMADRHGSSVALMLLDLDKFKDVNDNFGHPVGDELLKHAARVLQDSVRESDTVARIGGDEFAIILTNVEDPLRIRQVAERVVNGLSQPTVLDGSLIVAGVSIGISIYPRDAEDAKELVRLGDQALYAAKNKGRGMFQYYNGVMDATARRERILENELRLAVVREEFELFYQPQVSTRSGAIMAVESLIRWHHPDGRMKPPSAFIAHAEKTGIIADIGRQVLATACQEARRWSRMGIGVVPVAVNVSPCEIRHPDFVQTVTGALAAAGIDPEWLELEITENVALDTTGGVLRKLHDLSRLGVRIAIDDFGTGYASLAYLRKLPLRKLKIDRSLVAGMGGGGPDRAIAEAIVALGRTLRFESIAEGVENQDQACAVREVLCSGMQGYLTSRPIPAERMREWLADNHARV